MMTRVMIQLKHIVILCIICLILLPSPSLSDIGDSSSTNVGPVDHLMIQVPNASAAYDLFTLSFGLPVAWNLSDYKIFKSGGVSLGNVNLELLESSAKSKEEGLFPENNGIIGIAFQPEESLNKSLTILDKKQIHYGPPEPFTVDVGGLNRTIWTNVFFDGFMPGTQVFYCNYSFDEVKQRTRLESELSDNGGGPLGVIRLTEIGITYSNESVRSNWQRFLPLVNETSQDQLDGGGGVIIRLTPSDKDQISSIVIQVESLQKTKSVLQDMGVPYTPGNGSLFMELENVPGVNISYIQ